MNGDGYSRGRYPDNKQMMEHSQLTYLIEGGRKRDYGVSDDLALDTRHQC